MPVNILITSAGSTNGVNVIKALQKEIDWQKKWDKDVNPKYRVDMNLITADADHLASGLYMTEKHYVIPRADDKKFIPALLKICKKEKVDILLPILSYELPVIAKNKKKFAEIGVKMAVSKYEVYRKTENKVETNSFFKKNNVPHPKTYIEYWNNFTSYKHKLKFPAIIKPIKDTSGSKNVHKINDKAELDFYRKRVPESIVQEYIEGQEYTIDGLCNLRGKMLYALPRKRLEVRDGMAVKGITAYDKKLIDYTRRIVEGLKLVGAFNVQCIKRGQKIWFIEVNNRFGSGGLPLAVGAGLNIPMDIVRMLSGKKVPPFRDKKPWIYDKIIMTRYQDAIIIKKKI